jgi:hypothetical protein
MLSKITLNGHGYRRRVCCVIKLGDQPDASTRAEAPKTTVGTAPRASQLVVVRLFKRLRSPSTSVSSSCPRRPRLCVLPFVQGRVPMRQLCVSSASRSYGLMAPGLWAFEPRDSTWSSTDSVLYDDQLTAPPLRSGMGHGNRGKTIRT